MSEEPKTYDLDQVAFSFCGLPINGGYGDGQAIMIEKVDPSVTTKQGADGSLSWSKTGKKLYKVKITLMSTSSGNAKLSAIHKLDEEKPNGAGIGPLLIADLGGTTVFSSPKARIETMPPLDLGAEASNIEWTIFAADGFAFWGGN